ncbi:hypothetical protein [uncultured Anaerococcus sp.]|uniref:hypothetical protein n=1 Tax=uncultured Anaerococcus sp. TaxID=293428 RepID=UPI00288AD436|nr:hypothetical protein [uncultured Anaerococcus sp.]
MDRELAPKEDQELNKLSKRLLQTAPPMTSKEKERYHELMVKKIGTAEERDEEKKQNRKNFLAFQEQLSKK